MTSSRNSYKYNTNSMNKIYGVHLPKLYHIENINAVTRTLLGIYNNYKSYRSRINK